MSEPFLGRQEIIRRRAVTSSPRPPPDGNKRARKNRGPGDRGPGLETAALLKQTTAKYLSDGPSLLFSWLSSPASLPLSFLRAFLRLSSLPAFWPPFSWQASSLALSSSRPAFWRHPHRQRGRAWAWVREVAEERAPPAHSSPVPARRHLLLPPLPLRNLLRATRCRRRCRRILLLHHVRRVWDRRTSLLLLILFGRLAQERTRKAAGHEKLKDQQTLCWNGARL